MSTRTEFPISVDKHVTIGVSVDLCTYEYGNSGSYTVLYDGHPEVLLDATKAPRINLPIVFKLKDTVPHNIYFVAVTRKTGDGIKKLVCDISLDGRQLIWYDDREKPLDNFDITLHWVAGTPIWHDPQVRNKPTSR